MKKFKCLIAALLSASVMASGAALTACNGDGEGGGSAEPIDEQTWQAAFAEIRYENYTAKIIRVVDGQNDELSCKVTADGACQISESTVYTIKSGVYEGTGEDQFTTYGYYEGRGWFVQTDAGINYKNIKGVSAINAAYGDNFNKFSFNADTSEYLYDGAIEGTLIQYRFIYDEVSHEETYEESTVNIACLNNVVTVKDNKIVGIKCLLSCEGIIVDNATYEFYDFGTTEVTVPQEVIDAATANTPTN